MILNEFKNVIEKKQLENNQNF